jgi:O-antigen ligase
VPVAAAVAAAALGAATSAWPDLLHLDATFSWATSLGLAAGIAAAAVLVARPGLSLVILVAATWLNLSQVLVRFHGMPSMLQLVAAPIALAALRLRGVAGVAEIARRPIAVLAAAYALVLLVSTTYASDPVLATDRAIEQVKAVMVMILVALLCDGVARLRLACWALVLAAVVPAALAAFQEGSGRFDLEFGGLARVKLAQIHGTVFEERIAGPLGDPNFFAQVQLMLVPIALALAATEGARWRRRAAFGCGLVLAGSCVLSYSRGGALALAAIVGIWAFRHLRAARFRVRPRHVGGAVALAAVALLFVPADFARRLTTLRQMVPGSAEVLRPDTSFELRKLWGRAAWQMFLDHPVLGLGTANYTVHFDEQAAEIGSSARDDEAEASYYPHDLYLEIGAETGLVGLGAFALLMAAAFVALSRASRGRDPRAAAIAVGLQLGLLGWLLSSIFLHGHFPRHPHVLLGLALALDALRPGRDAA